MKYEQACEEARQHLAENPIPHHDYRWILAEPKKTTSGWLFDYSFECLLDIPPKSWEAVGGAPGFLVTENGVRDVSWEEYWEMSR